MFYVVGSSLLQSTDLAFMIKCLSAQLDLVVKSGDTGKYFFLTEIL